VAGASLASYDGSAGTLVDTNIWIDCIDAKSPWHDWAVEQLQKLSERSPLHVNLIVYTELLVLGPNIGA
jgi:predicted nucleic acid-binding protein